MSKILLVERNIGTVGRYASPEQINEEFHSKIILESPDNKAIFRDEYIMIGVCQRANAVNINNRLYPYDELNREMSNITSLLKDGGYLLGELDHTDDDYVRCERASHQILKYWWKDADVWGMFKLLNDKHDMAKRAMAIIDAVGHLGVSSRALGEVKFENGANRVSGLEWVTTDFVSEPSTRKAFLYRQQTQNENIQRILENIKRPIVLD